MANVNRKIAAILNCLEYSYSENQACSFEIMNFNEKRLSTMQMQETDATRLICKEVREKNIKKMQRSKI